MSSDPYAGDYLLRVGQVAERLGVKEPTVWKYLHSGRIPSIKVSGRVRRVRASDLDAFIAGLPYDRPAS